MPRTTLIQLRGGSAAEWAAANPVLALREPGVETDTRKLKVGDGTTAWNALPYLIASGDEDGGESTLIPYHQDGSLGYDLGFVGADIDPPTDITASWVPTIHDNDADYVTVRSRGGGGPNNYRMALMFGETYLIDSYYISYFIADGGGPTQWEYSDNATTPYDGTWTTIALTAHANVDPATHSAGNIATLDVPITAKALRITMNTGWAQNGISSLQLYGTPAPVTYATVDYVDAAVAAVDGVTDAELTTALADKVAKAGDTMTGKLTFDAAADTAFVQVGATPVLDVRYLANGAQRQVEFRTAGEVPARITVANAGASAPSFGTKWTPAGSTIDAPTGPASGVGLGTYGFTAYRPGANWYQCAQITAVSTEAWTNAATGSEMRFTVIPTGTRFTATPLIITGTGPNIAATFTLTMGEGANIAAGTTTGTKFGTAATQKLGWWNATPVVQNTGWTPTPGYTALKSFNPSSYTPDELARVVATLIDTLKSYGLLGGS